MKNSVKYGSMTLLIAWFLILSISGIAGMVSYWHPISVVLVLMGAAAALAASVCLGYIDTEEEIRWNERHH